MHFHHSISALVAISLAWAVDTSPMGDPGLTAHTSSGSFKGFIHPEVPDVNQWLGIPYGAPPVKDMRFMPPEPAKHSGTHDATSYKPICFQQTNVGQGVFWQLMPEFQNADPQSEDCLYLNIWGPRKPVDSALTTTEKVPVIIWVCGGGYREGGGHAPYQVPDNWVQRMQTHIVVTFNYRLNVFGFPGAAAAPYNVGLLDIRLVVEWVRDNIEAFGGDPDRMILWGQSAGGNAVDSYAYAHSDDDVLVTGLIADSGAAAQVNKVNHSSFSTLGSILGCGGLSSEEELACMQKVDARDIINLLTGTTSPGNISVPYFGVVADGLTAYENNTERMEKGLVTTVPLITGNTANEGAAFASFSMNQTEPPPASELEAGLAQIACPIKNEVDLRTQYGLPTYRYLFAGNFSNITPRYWLGAMHSSELPIIFGTHHEFRGNSTELEWLTSYAMEALWVSFAQDSAKDPTDGMGLTWPEYEASGNMVLFAEDAQPVQLVPGDRSDAAYKCP